MSFSNRVSQALYEEHRATTALLERLENLIARQRGVGPPDVADPAVGKLLTDLSAALEAEVRRHFGFEAERVFAYLDAAGESAIGEHLTSDHKVMRPIGVRLALLARSAVNQGFDAAGWDEFRRLAQDLCGRLLAHLQKEDMALVPLLEDTMDAETEGRLYEEYVEHA